MKVYLINLDRRPDRLAEMTERLNALGLEFERVSAVDAKTAKFVWQVSWWKAVVYKLGHLPTRGAIACYYSHRYIWGDMIAKDISHALVFEDDAEVIEWDDALAKINLRDFELDLLRLQYTEASTWIDYGFDGQEMNIAGHKAVNEMSYGTVAYLITIAGAKKCHRLGKFWFPVDCFDLWTKVVGLRTSVLRPSMFEQSDSITDIQISTTGDLVPRFPKIDHLFLRPIARPLLKHARRILIASQTRSLST